MLHKNLTHPKSIAIIGGSNNTSSPGGRVLKNLLDHQFNGKLYVVNPKETLVQGIQCFKSIEEIPNVDLAIIAIAAKFILETVRVLVRKKETKGFIIFSAGFSEKDAEGKQLETEITAEITEAGGSLLGPNNIGLINQQYTGVFTTPIPKLNPKGVDFISGSGATAVFIIEAAMASGLTFSSVYTVGNSAQTGVEDVLEHMDVTFDEKTSSKVKLLYIESIENPTKLLKHASSLIQKGCRIAAIKAGSSEAGSRAASSHTGALASPDTAVNALFKKAGIIRCHGRNELINVASVLLHPTLPGKNIAIITHAGGPAVMLTDVLTKNGLCVPEIKSDKKIQLSEQLFPGSSVRNPIDFLATGNAEQLSTIIDFCENSFDEIDAMVVIFGSPGLFKVHDVYEVLHQKMLHCKKPILPVLPSVVNVQEEIDQFIQFGRINFPDEVLFGQALTKVYGKKNREQIEVKSLGTIDKNFIRTIIDKAADGYLLPNAVDSLLKAAKIPVAASFDCYSLANCIQAVDQLNYPVVMKVIGPVHKSDVGGIILNVKNRESLTVSYHKLMAIQQTKGVLIQSMKKGLELIVGAKKEGKFGHLVLCGIGGIYVEVLKDISFGLSPISYKEASTMITTLKSLPILKGVRNQPGVDLGTFAAVIVHVATLVQIAPEIEELDLNPLLATANSLTAVDARIKIRK